MKYQTKDWVKFLWPSVIWICVQDPFIVRLKSFNTILMISFTFFYRFNWKCACSLHLNEIRTDILFRLKLVNTVTYVFFKNINWLKIGSDNVLGKKFLRPPPPPRLCLRNFRNIHCLLIWVTLYTYAIDFK